MAICLASSKAVTVKGSRAFDLDLSFLTKTTSPRWRGGIEGGGPPHDKYLEEEWLACLMVNCLSASSESSSVMLVPIVRSLETQIS